MNNKDNYKNAVNQIHASDELKEKAFENARYASSNKYGILKTLLTCAAVFVLVLVGINYLNNDFFAPENPDIAKKPIIQDESEKESVVELAKLPRFKSMNELKDAIKENGGYAITDYMGMNKELALDSAVAESEVSTSITPL